MNQVLLIAHVIVSLCIIGLVMMQQGKGADAGAAFGGGGGGASGSLFGASGAGTFLSRATAIFAVIFFSTSLGLAFLGGYKAAPVDLMDIDPMIEQESDLPVIEGSAQYTPEDLPVTRVQETPKSVLESESMSNEIPAIDSLEQVESVEQIDESVINEMPDISDDLPAIAN